MIQLTKLNGVQFWLNPHLIETIEATPDTMIIMISGTHVIVKETVPDVINKIIEYRKKLGINRQEE